MSIDRGVYVMDSHHPDRAVGSPCDECGFRPSTLTPPDAIVALRSFPRRYRGLLMPVVSEDDGADLLRHRGTSEWSAIEYTAHVRDTMHALEKRLARIAVEDDPPLAGLDFDAPPTGAHEQGPEIVLATLLTNIEAIARTAGGISGADWNRRGHLDGEGVSAVDLVMEAVHEGSHHLRDVERAIADARAGR